MVCMVALVPMTAQAYYAKQAYARFSCTAGETLTAGNVVMIKDADGYCYKADANDAALRPAVGVIGKGGASGASVEVIVQGIISGWTTLSEGSPGYLSETAAAITQSAPAYAQQVGYAINTTDYFINCQNYFDSSSLAVLGTLTGASPLVLEGATADDYETTVAPTDPTADRTITLPDATGTVALTAGLGSRPTVSAGSGTTTLTTADCGKVLTAAADADGVFNLPIISSAGTGCKFTFINAGANGNNLLTINPDNADQIFGTIYSGGTGTFTNTLVIAGSAGDAVSNTKSTAIRGDSMTLIVGDVDAWYIVDSRGVWADIN